MTFENSTAVLVKTDGPINVVAGELEGAEVEVMMLSRRESIVYCPFEDSDGGEGYRRSIAFLRS